MVYRYPLRDFALPKFLKHFEGQYKYDEGFVGDEISCTTAEELSAQGGMVICCVDIESGDFLLDDYKKYSDCEDYEEEYLIETYGKAKWNKILRLAKARHWQPDNRLSIAISPGGFSVAILVSLSGDFVELETGYAGGDSERSSADFTGGGVRGMPEIEAMIEDIVQSCSRKRKRHHE